MRAMPRLSLALLLATVGPGLTMAPGHAQVAHSSEVEVLERLAEERYAEGDLESAAELYREIAGKQPDAEAQAQALLTAAWLQHLAGNQPMARDLLQEASTLRPDHPFDPSLYSRDFEMLHRQARERAIRERHRDADSKTQSALTQIQAGRDEQARALLEAALELAPDNPTALYNLALLDLRSGRGREAIADFERVVSLTYQESSDESIELRAKALASIGVVYYQQERYADAEQAFLEATRTDPRQTLAWKNLGLTRLQRGDPNAAIAPLEQARSLLADDREVSLALAASLVESGRAGEAESTLETDLQRHVGDAEMWLELGRIERDQGVAEEAIHSFEQALAADPDNRAGIAATAAVEGSMVQLERENSAVAITWANQAAGWEPDNPAAWGMLGRAQLAAGEATQAVASLSRATDLDPTALDLLVLFGNTLLADGQLQQAEAIYLRALSIDPLSDEADSNLELVRRRQSNVQAIAGGQPSRAKPIPPKKIGLEFAGIDYKDLQLRGALVKKVNKKSPAARAGLRKGDLILWIGDYSVLSDKDFFQFLKRNPPGDLLAIEYLRDGRIHEADIQLR